MPAPDGDPENPGDDDVAPDATPIISDDSSDLGDLNDDTLDSDGEPPDATPTDDSETEDGTESEEEKDEDESTSPDNGDTQSEPPPDVDASDADSNTPGAPEYSCPCGADFWGEHAKQHLASHCQSCDEWKDFKNFREFASGAARASTDGSSSTEIEAEIETGSPSPNSSSSGAASTQADTTTTRATTRQRLPKQARFLYSVIPQLSDREPKHGYTGWFSTPAEWAIGIFGLFLGIFLKHGIVSIEVLAGLGGIGLAAAGAAARKSGTATETRDAIQSNIEHYVLGILVGYLSIFFAHDLLPGGITMDDFAHLFGQHAHETANVLLVALPVVV